VRVLEHDREVEQQRRVAPALREALPIDGLCGGAEHNQILERELVFAATPARRGHESSVDRAADVTR
jgi:hypothetical protein